MISTCADLSRKVKHEECESWSIKCLKILYCESRSIGYSAFRTAEGLKEWVVNIPEGDTLKWDSASDLPISGDPLGSPEAAEDFKKFCEAHKINLEIVPRP